jgi:hypothetical protein
MPNCAVLPVSDMKTPILTLSPPAAGPPVWQAEAANIEAVKPSAIKVRFICSSSSVLGRVVVGQISAARGSCAPAEHARLSVKTFA